MDENTKRLIGDYERLKYDSERTKRENAELKERNDTLSFLANEEQAKLGHYDSKESLQTKQQSLTVADLLQMDSVQKLNSKLEEKNSYLEQQIDLMKE